MFAKLLKQEWRATKRMIGLLCIIILISGLIIGSVMHYMMKMELQDAGELSTIDGSIVIISQEEAEQEPLSTGATILCIFLITAGIMAVAVCGAGSIFVVIYRFYRRCFTEEGYLTFTLPVGNHQILLSSFVNSILGITLVMLSCLAAIVIAAVLFLLAIDQGILWSDVWASALSALNQLWGSFLKNADTFLVLFFSGLCSAVSQLIVLMLSVTIGAVIAKKHKLLAAVGVYYGISLVQSFLSTMLAFSATTRQDVNQLLGFPGVLGIVITVAGYFLMHHLTSKRLNLT